jgi:hypothetical protein
LGVVSWVGWWVAVFVGATFAGCPCAVVVVVVVLVMVFDVVVVVVRLLLAF